MVGHPEKKKRDEKAGKKIKNKTNTQSQTEKQQDAKEPRKRTHSKSRRKTTESERNENKIPLPKESESCINISFSTQIIVGKQKHTHISSIEQSIQTEHKISPITFNFRSKNRQILNPKSLVSDRLFHATQ
jgi:hypothetical protein